LAARRRQAKIGDIMYAIIRSGNRQYRAEVGKTVDVERLPNAVNDSFDITDVLLVGDGPNTVIGQPTVEGATVRVTVLDQYRAEKVIVFKYRQRTNFRRKRGHRQYYTRLRIDAINV
jgi:large subunit ribosomal protein L21